MGPVRSFFTLLIPGVVLTSFVDLNHHLEMEDILLVCPLPLLRVEQLCSFYFLIVTRGYPQRIVNTTLVWADQ